MTPNYLVVDGTFQMYDLNQLDLIRLEFLVASGVYEISLYPEGYSQSRAIVNALKQYGEGLIRGVSGRQIGLWVIPYQANATPTHFIDWLSVTTQLTIENEINRRAL